MADKPSYEELQQRVKGLKEEAEKFKQGEETLHAYEQIISSVTDLMSFLDNNYKYVAVNDAYLKCFPDKSREDIIGHTPEDLVGEQDFRKKIRPNLDRCLKGEIANYQDQFEYPGRGERYVDVSYYPIFAKNGSVSRIVHISRDITQLKQIEGTLRRSEMEKKAILDAMSDVVLFQNPNLSIRWANAAAGRSVGKTQEALVGCLCFEEWHGRSEPCEGCPVVKAIETGSSAKSIMTTPDGKCWEVTADPVRDSKEKIVGAIKIARDITQYKRSEEALREERDKAQKYLDVAATVFVVIDRDEKVSLMNRKGCEILGVKEEEVIGRNWFDDFIPERIREEMRGVFQQLIGGQIEPVEYYENLVLIKGGDEKTIAWHNTVLKDEAGRINATLSSGEDITDKKRLEGQLQQAQKMEAIGTLAGGIAHDFNNLLSVIQGNASMMLFDIDATHPHYENIKNIENQVQRGSTLTRQLLGYARKGRYEVKPIDLNRLVEEISETFGRIRKEITIGRDLAEDLFPIEADESQIEQVLLNMYLNAGDAMPSGGDLILKTMNVTDKDIKGKLYDPKPGNYVLLTITDTGSGMDKETVERIFDPFFTTKEMGRGSGLGLASAYGIIRSHGGYIDVESEKQLGSRFSIYLPATEKKVEKTVRTVERVVEGSGTILMVDDEAQVLTVAVKLLKTLGYTVLEATGGRQAVEMYEANKDKIDLVILDMIMPDMGGGEAYDRIKEVNPDVKVLLSSGYSIDGQAKKILERGCDAFIQKPFGIQELSGKIREIVEKQ